MVSATPAPLVTITFLDNEGRHAIKHWYHVPRVGEQVYLAVAPREADDILGLAPRAIIGTVKQVKWDDDGSASVYVR